MAYPRNFELHISGFIIPRYIFSWSVQILFITWSNKDTSVLGDTATLGRGRGVVYFHHNRYYKTKSTQISFVLAGENASLFLCCTILFSPELYYFGDKPFP